MSKLSFRARALDCARPLCVWLAEELPEPPDTSAISRAVPALPSGMEKEEECEHHLQRAICTGLIIPTPEVSDTADLDFYGRCYPADYKMPRQLIHMQPLCLEQETPEYDMDSEDERWLRQQRRAELTELKFEEMMDRLERSSGQTVVTLGEAKLLLERQDDLVIAVYDYWLNKRLKTQHPLILSVKTENRVGQSANNPYLAFRRRTEKMQTRKNRKNDESSYEKMLKLRRELSRAASLLELVARRERAKRELVRLTALLAERRFTRGDYAGQLLDELQAAAPQRSAAYPPSALAATGAGGGYRRDAGLGYGATHYAPRAGHAPSDHPRLREKRQYKRRKHRHHSSGAALREGGVYSSSEEEAAPAAGAGAGAGAEAEPAPAAPVDDGPFAFRRKAGVYYQAPTPLIGEDYETPVSPSAKENHHLKDKRFRFTLTSISHPYPKCIGFARRRLGRGGRVVLDRVSTPLDDLWAHLRYRLPEPRDDHGAQREDQRHRYPLETSRDYHSGGKYGWRHAFRQHCAKNAHLWTSSDVKKEKMDIGEVKLDSVDRKHDQNLPLDHKYVQSLPLDHKYVQSSPTDVKCDESLPAGVRCDQGLPSDHKYAVSEVTVKCAPLELDGVLPRDLNKLNGDISCSRGDVEAGVRASLARHVRGRRRSSESSCEGAPLEPREREFAEFLEQVNTEWLHFRPKTPPAEPACVTRDTDRLALTADTPIAVELRLGAHDPPSRAPLEDMSPFTTSEFTLADIYGDSLLNAEPGESSGSLDASGDDTALLADNFSGLTDAQVESILSDTDLKAFADDDKKSSIDLLKPDDADAILEELVKGEVNGKTEDPFLLSGQSAAGRGTLGASVAYSGQKRRKKAPKYADFGSSVVTVTPIEDDEPIYADLIPPPPPEPPKTSTPVPKVSEPAPQLRKPIEKPAVKEELVTAEPKRKLLKEDVIEDVQLAQGVQLKTVQTKHSPLKKHIISSAAHRRSAESVTLVTSQDSSQPQIVTVAVSESLKMRLQNHLLVSQQQGAGSSLQTNAGATVMGLVQNGPFAVSSAGGVASVSVAAMSREGTVSVGGVASTSSPRRVSAPLVHLTPAALHQKQLQQLSQQPPVVVAHPHALQHNKLKVLHAHSLTQSQRTQLLAQSRAGGLAQMPAVVSLSALGDAKATSSAALQLKAAPGSVAQFFEIKSGQLGKGTHLVNVVRQPQPGKTTVARLDLNDPKKRGQVVATFDGTLKGNIARATTPHRLSVSLDGRHIVRAALPTVRAHPVRHPIQLKNRTLVATPQQQASTSITIAAPSKATPLPNSVVANLLQKNAMGKGGQKIAIAGGAQGLANVQAFTAFTHAQQLKARQARLVAQPRPNQTAEASGATAPTAAGAAPAGDGADPSDGTNGSVRRRPAETLPMEVT